MGKLFIQIYNFFEKYKALFYLSLLVWVGIMIFFASKIKFEENITRIFPHTKNSKNIIKVFDNLRVKDKIIIMFSSDKEDDHDTLIKGAAQFKNAIDESVTETHINSILFKADDELQAGMMDMIYNNLPLYLSDEDYNRMDSLFMEGRIELIMQRNYKNLISPTGIVMREYIMRDPLGIGGEVLKGLQDFQLDASYDIQNGYIFSQDGKTLLMFISPKFDMGNTSENDILIKAIEKEINLTEKEFDGLTIEYFGGPSVGVYNARQIKQDTMLTLTIALVIILIFIFLVFKNKKSIPLMLTPVIFGGLFSLFIIYLVKGSISSIAVGTGSIVLGIALSYSIHMVAHQNHVSSIRQLIGEIAYPLTIGSFTTICAFLGLLFTSSELLQDFGLFASMSLIGTTLFCLIYLPHFLSPAKGEKESRILRFIEKFNAYRFDKNKWLIGGLFILIVICIFTSKRVGFDNDMMNLNYEPKHVKEAENKLTGIFESTQTTIYFVSTGNNDDEAISSYNRTNQKLEKLKQEGIITNYASADRFIISDKMKQERLEKWENYWTPEKKEFIETALKNEGAKLHFKTSAFESFINWLNSDFSHLLEKDSNISGNYLSEFKSGTNDFVMLISQVQFDKNDKDEVYAYFIDDENMEIFDRGYFTNKFVSAINDDFYLVLYISSFLIFFALLLSFGRIELTLISFMPMFISWIIIIGIMGIFGLQFNIVSIILSTFIFGIGDDFSIFIMDGLQNKYRTGKKILNSHKTAIFFSAFTIIVGMGAMVFAKHPALQSISWMSILGMIVVVLVSYTLQPVVFRWFITNPTSKGNPPYTLIGLLNSGFIYLIFVVSCLLIKLVIYLLYLIPISKKKKQQAICWLIMISTRMLLHIPIRIHFRKLNIDKDFFDKPSIVIANHQSFLDIVTLLSLSSKLVMVTNEWVWKSPVFGSIIRYAGYFFTGNGYEENTEAIQKKMSEGYSIVIFPEGTRSADGNIKRFHRGAFYIAEKLNSDIRPIVLYGTGNLIPKKQPFYIKRGFLIAKALPVIKPEDKNYGENYRERTKSIAAYYHEEYDKICMEYTNAENSYFNQRLIQNYIYKGPVLEWYVRIKVKMEKSYKQFDEIIPKKGQITDIGCGYGTLVYMLNMLSPERRLLGIDYDEDKIDVAKHNFSANNYTHFECNDALSSNLPLSDVFVLNDILHYMNYEKQELLLKKCFSLLQDNGMVIVRDGNKQETEKQKMTKLTEVLSTRVFKFNKTQEELCFTSFDRLQTIANSCNMNMENYKNDNITSNTIFIFRKNNAYF